MKNLLKVICLAVVATSAAYAQDPEISVLSSDENFQGAAPIRQLQVNDESSYRPYETSRELIFRRAALKAAQRRSRMATNARFGYSPSRPPSSTLPAMGSPIGPPTALRIFTPYPGFAFPRQFIRF